MTCWTLGAFARAQLAIQNCDYSSMSTSLNDRPDGSGGDPISLQDAVQGCNGIGGWLEVSRAMSFSDGERCPPILVGAVPDVDSRFLVRVVAPATEQSAKSGAMTVHGLLDAQRHRFQEPGTLSLLSESRVERPCSSPLPASFSK